MELKEQKITVHYYAIFREQADKTKEERTTLSGTPEELYYELKEEYAFTLSIELVKVAINNVYSNMDAELNDGDEVLFIAPVAGG